MKYHLIEEFDFKNLIKSWNHWLYNLIKFVNLSIQLILSCYTTSISHWRRDKHYMALML